MNIDDNHKKLNAHNAKGIAFIMSCNHGFFDLVHCYYRAVTISVLVLPPYDSLI